MGELPIPKMDRWIPRGRYFWLEGGGNSIEFSRPEESAACCGVNLAFDGVGLSFLVLWSGYSVLGFPRLPARFLLSSFPFSAEAAPAWSISERLHSQNGLPDFRAQYFWPMREINSLEYLPTGESSACCGVNLACAGFGGGLFVLCCPRSGTADLLVSQLQSFAASELPVLSK